MRTMLALCCCILANAAIAQEITVVSKRTEEADAATSEDAESTKPCRQNSKVRPCGLGFCRDPRRNLWRVLFDIRPAGALSASHVR